MTDVAAALKNPTQVDLDTENLHDPATEMKRRGVNQGLPEEDIVKSVENVGREMEERQKEVAEAEQQAPPVEGK